MKRSWRPVVCGVSVCVVVIAVASTTMSATAAEGGSGTNKFTWSKPVTVTAFEIPQNTINAVSCPATTLCALASLAGVFVSTAPAAAKPAWSYDGDPGGVHTSGYEGMSCPSTTMCVATGGTTVDTSTDPAGGGEAWQHIHPKLPLSKRKGGLGEVSCTGPALCVAVFQANSTSTTYNTSHTWLVVSRNPMGARPRWRSIRMHNDVSGITCVPRLCIASTDEGAVDASKTPQRGGSWRATRLIPKYVALGITTACAVATYCNANGVSWSKNAAAVKPKWRATRWSRRGPYTDSVTCLPDKFCALTTPHDVFAYASWPRGYTPWTAMTIPHLAKRDGYLRVSCATPDFCVVGDFDGHVITAQRSS